MKIAFQTLGCKLNFAETSALGHQLREGGFVPCKAGEEADVVIINTCSVTDTADKKGRQMIHRMIKKHPHAYIVVTGCYAQLKPEEIANIEGVDLVLGANEKVVFFIIRQAKLHRPLALAGNSVEGKLGLGGGINGIPHPVPDLLGAGGRGAHQEPLGQAPLLKHPLKNKLCHGASANIPVANKHNPNRLLHFDHSFQI